MPSALYGSTLAHSMSQRKLSFAGEISREVESTIKKLKKLKIKNQSNPEVG